MASSPPRKLRIPSRLLVFGSVPVLLIAAGTEGYRLFEGWSWFDSFYVAVITLTSIGYGERAPVTIAGRVVRPLGAPVQRVIVKRRLSCGRYRVIKRFTPPASGRFRITVGGPGSQQAAVYRLQTRVRKFVSNPRLYPTFTLPRYVDLAQ